MRLLAGAGIIPFAPSYGQIYTDNQSVALAIPTQNTFVKLIAFATGGVNGVASSDVTPDKANSRIQVTKAGDYWIQFTHGFVGNANQTFETEVFAGPIGSTVAKVQVQTHQRSTNANDTASGSCSGIVTLAANDVVELWCTCTTTNTTTITTEDVFLSLWKIK